MAQQTGNLAANEGELMATLTVDRVQSEFDERVRDAARVIRDYVRENPDATAPQLVAHLREQHVDAEVASLAVERQLKGGELRTTPEGAIRQ